MIPPRTTNSFETFQLKNFRFPLFIDFIELRIKAASEDALPSKISSEAQVLIQHSSKCHKCYQRINLQAILGNLRGWTRSHRGRIQLQAIPPALRTLGGGSPLPTRFDLHFLFRQFQRHGFDLSRAANA
jgi:hypothetical protein